MTSAQRFDFAYLANGSVVSSVDVMSLSYLGRICEMTKLLLRTSNVVSE